MSDDWPVMVPGYLVRDKEYRPRQRNRPVNETYFEAEGRIGAGFWVSVTDCGLEPGQRIRARAAIFPESWGGTGNPLRFSREQLREHRQNYLNLLIEAVPRTKRDDQEALFDRIERLLGRLDSARFGHSSERPILAPEPEAMQQVTEVRPSGPATDSEGSFVVDREASRARLRAAGEKLLALHRVLRARKAGPTPAQAEGVNYDYEDDPGRCAECGAPCEFVRPGSSQPTCNCWDSPSPEKE